LRTSHFAFASAFEIAGKRREAIRRHAVRLDPRQRRQSEPTHGRVAGDQDGTRPIADLRRVARRDGALGRERRSELGQRLHGRGGADPFVAIDHDRFTLVLGNLDRDDLVVEPAFVPRGGRACVRTRRPRVLRPAVHPVFTVHVVGANAHVLIVERAPQPVVDHRVEHRRMPEPLPGAGLRQHERRVRHRFHAPGDRDLDLTGSDHLIGHRDRGHPRRTDLVDRDRGHIDRDTGGHGGLTGGDLSLPGLQHVPHDRVVDRVRLDTGSRERRPDRGRAELHRAQAREPPWKRPIGVRTPVTR
jgi:hypothetical protein